MLVFNRPIPQQIVTAGAGVLTLQDGATAQTLRVYGTTTGPKYAALSHDGVSARVTTTTGDNLIFAVGATDAWYVAGSTNRFIGNGNYGLSHGTSALAVGATEGFYFEQSCAGTPTGTPATIPSGQIPSVVNSVSGQLAIYAGAAWKALPRILDVNSTAVGNVGAGTDPLITYTTPAGILDAAGKTLRIKAWGTTANNANVKTLTFQVGGNTVLTTILTASIVGQWVVEVYVIRTGVDTQDVQACTLQGATLIFDQEVGTMTLDDALGWAVGPFGAATSNNDIVCEGMVTEIIN